MDSPSGLFYWYREILLGFAIASELPCEGSCFSSKSEPSSCVAHVFVLSSLGGWVMIPLFVVDAFADRPFSGNPAAICLLPSETPSEWMQSMASEMNLAETAFVFRTADGLQLRWFTPVCEVDLCGHATLAAAHILWQEGWFGVQEPIVLNTKSGPLTAKRQADGLIELDFPLEPAVNATAPIGFEKALGLQRPPIAIMKNRMDWLIHVDGAEELRQLSPDMMSLSKLPGRGWIITCASDSRRYDFLSRFFGPAVGINEDPVTGSAHCCLVGYWSEVLDKTRLVGYQASKRGGEVTVEIKNDRSMLCGKAVTVVWGRCQF